ncbi:MAG: D-2-hydroxyacid dehydrogenase [Halieaceae bacterium]
MPRLLVISQHAQRFKALLEAAGLPQLEAQFCLDAETAKPWCAEAEILFGAPDRLASVLPLCPRLHWLQSSWAGVKPLLDQGRRDYQLTGVKGIFGPLMSEYVLGWLLALERNIPERYSARQWDDRSDGSLRGKRVGIMGTGSIGQHVAHSCRHFGMSTRGLNSNGRPVDGFDDCLAQAQRLQFAQDLDYLVALLPETAATDQLIEAKLLSRLRPGAILVNGGRANCIEQSALLDALSSGQLRHAVLDVLPQEPLPANDPLWQVANLSITSHTAAPTGTEAIAEIFCDNYRRYLDGAALQHLVDFERGY